MTAPAIGQVPDLAILFVTVLLAVFLMYWAVYSVITLALILLKHGPETVTEGVSIGLREAPFAISLAFVMVVGSAYFSAKDEFVSAREAIR